MRKNKRLNNIEDTVKSGSAADVDKIMSDLDTGDFTTSRIIDFHLNNLVNPLGVERLEHYLFEGTLIQRNYCCLFFARRNEWKVVNKAYLAGCIDEIQAYSR